MEEDRNDQHFIFAELAQLKPSPKTAHELLRPSNFEGSLKHIAPIPNDSIKQEIRPKSKSKQHPIQQKTQKVYSKCVRIVLNSNKSIGSKSYSCQNISSLNDIAEGECSLDEIDLAEKKLPLQEAKTVQNIKKNTIMKKQSKKIKSYRDLMSGTNLNIVKSSKSIKFSEKKDIFTYKCQNKKQNTKKKTKSYRKAQFPPVNQSEECCQLI